MQLLLATVAALLACALVLPVGAVTREEYKAQRLRVQDKYATDKDRCSTQQGHQVHVCKAQAKAAYDIARYELRSRFKPTPRNAARAAQARADSEYDIAQAQCGDLAGSARKVCVDEAKAKWAGARDGVKEAGKRGS